MDINTLALIGFVSLSSYIVYQSLKPQKDPFKAERYGLLVAQDTGKTKVNQSKTGDASLFVQKVRRAAIRSSGGIPKESSTQFGSTTGAIETYLVNE